MCSSGIQNSAVHQLPHPPNRPLEPPEHRVRDDRVADVQLFDLRNGGHWTDIQIGEPVSGMDREPRFPGVAGRALELGERAAALAPGMGVPSRVQLHGRDAQGGGAVDGAGVGVDEEGNADPGVLEPTWFCDAYASWQKGGIENANGRLRRWLPRKLDIDQLSDEDIQEIVLTVNLTPRKCLGFRTPFQAILDELGKDVKISFA